MPRVSLLPGFTRTQLISPARATLGEKRRTTRFRGGCGVLTAAAAAAAAATTQGDTLPLCANTLPSLPQHERRPRWRPPSHSETNTFHQAGGAGRPPTSPESLLLCQGGREGARLRQLDQRHRARERGRNSYRKRLLPVTVLVAFVVIVLAYS